MTAKGREPTFNSASYAMSHLKHNLSRSVTTILTLAITVAFLLLTSSMLFGLMSEIRGTDEKRALLEGRDMFDQFELDRDLSEESKTTLVNFLIITTLFVFLVAFFIMFNTMSIAVRERKKEIGILRSVGYDSKDVMRIFLTEGGMIGSIAWVTAVFLGTPLIVNLAAYLIERGEEGLFFVQPRIPWPLLLISLAATLALCLSSTYLATVRAVRAPPVKMLRTRV